MGTPIEPYQTLFAETHFNYLEECKPQYLEQLYREGRLKDYLNEIVERAELSMKGLQEAGRREDEALEVVTYELLTPPMPEEWKTKRLSAKLEKEIRRSLCI